MDLNTYSSNMGGMILCQCDKTFTYVFIHKILRVTKVTCVSFTSCLVVGQLNGFLLASQRLVGEPEMSLCWFLCPNQVSWLPKDIPPTLTQLTLSWIFKLLTWHFLTWPKRKGKRVPNMIINHPSIPPPYVLTIHATTNRYPRSKRRVLRSI
jgi:hypothetical protein